MNPGRNSLETIIRSRGIDLSRAQFDQLWRYHQMLRAANVELNLTRIHQFENMVLKHYVDCLLVLKYADLPSPLVDMGSGPGLPGIPLKIARPHVRMILAEPRGARADFLREVVAELGLDDVEVYANKVGSKFPFQVEGVITRAVASIPETLDRVARCLLPGGKMLFMKGPDCDDEIVEARRGHSDLFEFEADHSYVIPGTPHQRRLVVYRRTETPVPDRPGDEKPRFHPGPVREVLSESNATFKQARDLLTGKGIRKNGLALISGARVVAELIEREPTAAEGWLTLPDGPPPPIATLTWIKLAKELFAELDTAGTRSPLLMVKVPEPETWSPEADWPDGCTLFVPFQDPENVGAVVRSAAAFGVKRVVLLQEAAHPFHPKSVRAGGSALFQVEFQRGPSIKELASELVPLIPLDASGEPIDAAPFPRKFGLVPGIEGPGLPEHLRRLPSRRIPIAENVESLNAATATAVALFSWRRSSGA